MGVIFLEGASESGHVVLVFRTRPALPRIQRMCPVGLVCRDEPFPHLTRVLPYDTVV